MDHCYVSFTAVGAIDTILIAGDHRLNAILASCIVVAIDTNAKLFSQLTHKKYPEALQAIMKASLMVVIIAICQSLTSLVATIIGLNWRRRLQKYLHGLYLHDGIMYRMNISQNGGIDNIDNRITTDVNNVTLGLVQNLMIAFIPNTMISLALLFYAMRVNWFSALMTLVWTLVSMCIGQFLMSRVTRSTFVLTMREGTFRYLHGRIRTFAESIAFYGGEDKERIDTDASFADVYAALM